MKPHRHPYFQSAVISKTMSASTSASTSALWLAMVCACSATLAQADEILFGDQTYHRVEVMGYEAGILEYRTTSGAYDKLPLDEIDMLVIDSITGVADFNAAEAFLAKGSDVQATERYERVLRSARGMWANITRVRLLIAADRAGLYEKAVRTFLDVAALEPTTAAKLLPMQLPQTRNRATARSLKHLEEMLGDAPSDETRTLVELLHYDMLRALGDPRAEKLAEIVAQRPIPANLITQRTAAIITSALSTQLTAGRVTETINEINALLVEAPDAVRAEWMLLKARAILSNAHQDDDFLRAASVAMRVAIHYADTTAGGEGLLIAAEAHEKSGRNPEAVRLLRECLRRNATAPDAKTRAREAIARLTASKSTPPLTELRP